MTPSDMGLILTQGAGQVGDSLPGALAWAVAVVAVIAAVNVAWRLLLWWSRGRLERLPLRPLPPAVPCPCCTGPGWSNDCTCREACGEPWCQAADPEEPMFFEGAHVIDRAGRQALIGRAQAEDRLEAEADAMHAEWEKQQEGRNG